MRLLFILHDLHEQYHFQNTQSFIRLVKEFEQNRVIYDSTILQSNIKFIFAKNFFYEFT